MLETDAYEVNAKSIAYINIQDDVEPLIKINTFYDIVKTDSGNRHIVRYNLRSLEQQV